MTRVRHMYMAIDQYGQTQHGLDHIGWIIAGCWYTVYRVTPMGVAV